MEFVQGTSIFGTCISSFMFVVQKMSDGKPLVLQSRDIGPCTHGGVWWLHVSINLTLWAYHAQIRQHAPNLTRSLIVEGIRVARLQDDCRQLQYVPHHGACRCLVDPCFGHAQMFLAGR
jgi:hypothetical protein